MLPLTRPVRQALATLGLLAFAVAPTSYVIYTAWSLARPAHVRLVEAEFRREIGLSVTLESVRYPRPGEVVFGGLVVRQDDSRKTGTTASAEAEAVRVKRSGAQMTIETSGLKLRGDGAEVLLAQVNNALRRASGSEIQRITLAIPGCNIELGSGKGLSAYQLKDVAGEILTNRGNPKSTLSLRVADERGSTRCELTYSRESSGASAKTSVACRTMEGPPVSATVLNSFFAAKDWMGEDARVWGSLTLNQVGQEAWSGQFQGDLTDINLASVIADRFPSHRLSGKAKLALKSARWGDRPGQGFGWVEAEGDLTAGQGSISPSLIKSLASEMQFRASPRVQSLDLERDLEFRALGTRFHLLPNGEIRIAGGLASEFDPDGVLVAQAQVSPIARAPQGAANVRGLIKAMFPGDASTLVPGTAESQVVQRYLPLPPGLADARGQVVNGN